MAAQENAAVQKPADHPHKEPQSKGPLPHQPVDSVVVFFFEISASQDNLEEKKTAIMEHVLAVMTEFGGRSSGTAENSIRAYFTQGKEALKAAVKIQQFVLTTVAEGPAGEPLETRIGIHFADTVAPGRTISDVVGMATRLARGAGPSQIFVSQPVHDAAADLHGVHFEPVSVFHKAVVWDGPPVYRVNWDKAVDYKPGTCVVLYFRPVWTAADGSFPSLWSTVIREEGRTWSDRIVKKQVLPDNSLGFVIDEGRSAATAAHILLRFIRDRLEKEDEKTILPVQAFIHLYDRGGEGIPTISESHFPASGVDPGSIYISDEALAFIGNKGELSVVSGKEASTLPSWQKVALELEQDGDEVADFLHRPELFAGNGRRCFYCGNRRHKAADCPSKYLPDNTKGFEKLGYFSVKEINSLFRKFLKADMEDPQRFRRDVVEGQSAHLGPAFDTFYDLNKIFQLRFFRSLFFAPGNEWGKKTDSNAESKGGQQWLALDSLRVSEWVRAESLLKEAVAKHPEDYRIYCTLGFLYAERGDLAEAEYHLKKAFKHTKVNTSRIFVHFLLCRLNRLLDRLETARRNVSDILVLDPGCPEALYEDVWFRLKEGDEKGGLQRLSILIMDDRNYYVQSLIDPDFAPFQERVNDHLKGLFTKVKEEAETLVHSVDEEIRKSTAVLREKDLQEVRSLRSEIQSLLDSRSYFGYLDITAMGATITKICKNAVLEQRKEAERLLNSLARQTEKDLGLLLDYSFPKLTHSYYKQLEQIQEKILAAKKSPPPVSPEELDTCVIVREEIKTELARIESEFTKLEGWRQILLNGFKFVKYFLILLAAVLVVGVFVLPVVIGLLNPLLTRFDLPTFSDINACRSWFVMLGGAASLIASFLLTTTRVFKGKHGSKLLGPMAAKGKKGKKPIKGATAKKRAPVKTKKK
ncbi:MAG TPA: hypothetical protein VGJ94_02960 [Syntrophorhabdaceae bacterium]